MHESALFGTVISPCRLIPCFSLSLSLLHRPCPVTHLSWKADGHCLYRSIHDQLRVTAATAAAAAGASAADGGSGGSCSNSSDGGDAADVPDHLELRRLAAAHIRKHRCHKAQQPPSNPATPHHCVHGHTAVLCSTQHLALGRSRTHPSCISSTSTNT